MHHVVDPGYRDFAAFDGLLEVVAEETAARHFLVETGQSRFIRAVRPAPIGHHPTLEFKGFLQHLVQRVVVLAGPIAVDFIV